jgi:predicted transcriptional regulator
MLKLEDTKIKDADFTHEVVVCHPDDHIKDILKVLKLKNIGSVIVINSDDQVLGLFSQRDYLIRVPMEKLDLEREKVKTYMNSNPLKLYLDSNLSGAISSLAASNSRHIVLVDDDEKPVGVLSQGDIIKYLAKSIKVLESTLS